MKQLNESQNSNPNKHEQSEYEVSAAIQEQKPREQQFGRTRADRQLISSRPECFYCGATDHFKDDCFKLKNNRTVPVACDICNGVHYLRQCPKWETVKQICLKMAILPIGTLSASGTRSVRKETSKSRGPEPDATIVVLAHIYNPSGETETACPKEKLKSAPISSYSS